MARRQLLSTPRGFVMSVRVQSALRPQALVRPCLALRGQPASRLHSTLLRPLPRPLRLSSSSGPLLATPAHLSSLSSSSQWTDTGDGFALKNTGLVAADHSWNPDPSFLALLHTTFQKHIHNDPVFVAIAPTFPSSYMPIYDMRAPPVYGRTPAIEDVFGLVLVDDAGIIIPESYLVNDVYRLHTPSGPPVFTEHMLFEMTAAASDAS
ncbi:hypothetical protein V1511DRAFT_251940 [Dipodascopsis uninucleata]